LLKELGEDGTYISVVFSKQNTLVSERVGLMVDVCDLVVDDQLGNAWFARVLGSVVIACCPIQTHLEGESSSLGS
jgi:hypothetical protein